jgi:lysophospholipase L1-like esterase
MAVKKADFARPWRDQRPLIVLAGDSHIEMGDWYDTFGGAFAMRNCGLSRAKIEDVYSLVSAMGDRNPEAVILMCGFNNLSRNDSVESSISHYQELLSITQATLHPGEIIVLSVMPLHVSAVDKTAQAINQKIAVFNRQLEKLCGEHHAVFVNVNPAIMDATGSLLPGLTIDGLHLNREGYNRLAAVLPPFLTQSHSSANHASH